MLSPTKMTFSTTEGAGMVTGGGAEDVGASVPPPPQAATSATRASVIVLITGKSIRNSAFEARRGSHERGGGYSNSKKPNWQGT
jgi:hypothetical protein